MYRDVVLMGKHAQSRHVIVVLVSYKDSIDVIDTDSDAAKCGAERLGASARIDKYFCAARRDKGRVALGSRIKAADLTILHCFSFTEF